MFAKVSACKSIKVSNVDSIELLNSEGEMQNEKYVFKYTRHENMRRTDHTHLSDSPTIIILRDNEHHILAVVEDQYQKSWAELGGWVE